MSLNQELAKLLQLTPGQEAFQPFQQLANRLLGDLLKSLSDDLEPAPFIKLVQIFTVESYDQIYRRQAGNLILELLKHSGRAQTILRQAKRELKKGIGQVVLSSNSDVLKYLAGAIVHFQQHHHAWSPDEFWPSNESQVATIFPKTASATWAQDFHEFFELLVENRVAEHAGTVAFYANAINMGDGKPLESLRFKYSVPGEILCELNELHLTCTRIATELERRTWFVDLSLKHILRSIPHVRPKSSKDRRVGQAFNRITTHDQLELKLDTQRSRWLFNGISHDDEVLVLVLDPAIGGKEVAKDFKERMHKQPSSVSVPIGGPVACQSSDPPESKPAPIGPSMIAALRDSQTNTTALVSKETEKRPEDSHDLTVVEDSYGRSQKEHGSDIKDPEDDSMLANHTITDPRVRKHDDNESLSKVARKPGRPLKAPPGRESQGLVGPNTSATATTVAQPVEDTYTQLYDQTSASHKVKPGKTYKPQTRASEAPAKKPPQATKPAAGKRKKRSTNQFEPGHAFSTVDKPPTKKQRTVPVGNAMADDVEVAEDTIASHVKMTKSSKTTSKTTTRTRKRLERNDPEAGHAEDQGMLRDDMSLQVPTLRDEKNDKSLGVAGRDSPPSKASQSKQDMDRVSRFGENGNDAAYADIDTLVQDPEPTPNKFGRKVAATVARPSLSEHTLMAEVVLQPSKQVIDLDTPETKSIVKPTLAAEHPTLALPDDRMNRKARIIEFGSRGALNQGSESPDKQTEQTASEAVQRSRINENVPRPMQITGTHAARSVLTPSHVHVNTFPNAQDSNVEGTEVTLAASYVADESVVSPGVDLGIDRTGSQLSQRVSGEGSPYSKNVRLPVVRLRNSHGLNTSSDQAPKRDRGQSKVLEPPFEYVQPPKSSLPPSRNPDNDVDRPSRDLPIPKKVPAAVALAVQSVATHQGDQNLRVSSIATSKTRQSQTAGRMLPPAIPTKRNLARSNSSKVSDLVVQTETNTTKSQSTVPRTFFESVKDLSETSSGRRRGNARFGTSSLGSKIQSQSKPTGLAPDTPVPELVKSKQSATQAHVSSKVATHAALHSRPNQFVKPVVGDFLAQPPSTKVPSHALRGRLDHEMLQTDFTKVAPGPSRSIQDSHEEVVQASATLRQEPPVRHMAETRLKAPMDMIKMFTEQDENEYGADSDPIRSPSPRMLLDQTSISPALKMTSSDVEQEVSRPVAEEAVPEPVIVDPTPTPNMPAEPAMQGSRFTAFLEQKVRQKQLNPMHPAALDLFDDVQDSEKTLVAADDDTHVSGGKDDNDHGEDEFEKHAQQQEDGSRSDGDIRMSDHSSCDSDRSSASPGKGAAENEEEADEGDESDPQAEEEEFDAEYIAYQQHRAWQKALQSHQEDYHQSFASISEQLVRHILNDETSIRATIADYEAGGKELIRRLEDSYDEEMQTHAAASDDAATKIKIGLAKVVADLEVLVKGSKDIAHEVRGYKQMQELSTDEGLGNLDRMIELWG